MKQLQNIIIESLLDDGDEIMDKVYRSSFEHFKEIILDPKSYRKLSQGSYHLSLDNFESTDTISAIFDKVGVKDIENFSILIKKIDKNIGWGEYEKYWDVRFYVYKHNGGFAKNTVYPVRRLSFPKLLNIEIGTLIHNRESFTKFLEGK
jgi:hypothetical protein